MKLRSGSSHKPPGLSLAYFPHTPGDLLLQDGGFSQSPCSSSERSDLGGPGASRGASEDREEPRKGHND